MDIKLQQQIINDSTLLLAKTAELTERAAKIPELEKQAGDLALEVARLNKEAGELRTRLSDQVQKAAARFVERGVLTQDKVAQFVQLIEQDPAQIVEVMDKIAGEATVQSLGGPSGDSTKLAEGAGDPLENFCMS